MTNQPVVKVRVMAALRRRVRVLPAIVSTNKKGWQLPPFFIAELLIWLLDQTKLQRCRSPILLLAILFQIAVGQLWHC